MKAFLLTLSAIAVFALTFGSIMFTVNAADESVKQVFVIDKSMNTTINGVTYFFNYTRNEKVKCISDDAKSFATPACYATKKDTTLDKNTVHFVNSSTPLILVDKSKYIQIDGQKYEIQYIPNDYIRCICEKEKGCKVKECLS